MTRLPPGPQTHSYGQLVQLLSQPTRFLTTCADRYGDTFALDLWGRRRPPAVFLSDPDSVEALSLTAETAFTWGELTYVFQPLTGAQSLIAQEVAGHRRLRKLLVPPLHGQRLAAWRETIVNTVSRRIASWSPGTVLSMRAILAEISLDIILEVVLGIQPQQPACPWRSCIQEYLELACSTWGSLPFFFPTLQQNWGPWSPWGRFLARRQRLDRLLYEQWQLRQREPGQDVLTLLIEAKDETGQGLTFAEIRDQLVTLLLLGHETTASALAWALALIHEHPAVLARIQSELQLAPRPLTTAKLPYLEATCRETLRLQPIALISQPRLAKEALVLGDYHYPPGTALIPCIYLAHRRSELFAEPNQFKPERFLEQTYSPYAYFPFGVGSRSCIGQGLSWLELQLVLATLLSTWEFDSINSQPPRPERRGITIVPSTGPRLKLRRPCPSPSQTQPTAFALKP